MRLAFYVMLRPSLLNEWFGKVTDVNNGTIEISFPMRLGLRRAIPKTTILGHGVFRFPLAVWAIVSEDARYLASICQVHLLCSRMSWKPRHCHYLAHVRYREAGSGRDADSAHPYRKRGWPSKFLWIIGK